MKTPILVFLFVWLSLNPLLTYAQGNVRAKGNSLVRQERNMTNDQTREKAEELAMIDAIRNKFGTYVQQETEVDIINGTVKYDIIGSTRVKGDWLRTVKKEFTEDVQDQIGNNGRIEKVIWVSCKIVGEIREVVSKAKIEVKLLRCPKIECETTTFHNKQNLYLYFVSPVDGYLSVFVDEERDTTRRVFPYLKNKNESAIKIEGDKPYLLFSHTQTIGNFATEVDEMELLTESAIEYNTVYVIFSQQPYSKLSLTKDILQDGYILPKSISSSLFQNWLADCRSSMPDFQFKRIKISISK